MTGAAALAAALLFAAEAPPPCGTAGPQPGPGTLEPFRAPAPRAVELNAAGKVPYRLGKWDEARAQYRAAQAADPEFLAPRLNVACSFVRQERFAEAKAEVIALLDRAYLPWAREILEAADLGALKGRPEMADIRRAMTAAAAAWGAELPDSVVFVARQRPPLRVPPTGEGVFILNPHQEVWAYSPRTQRYRQLTVTDGHVVALARTADGRRLAYATAEKLVRGPRPNDVALRGVTLHELDLPAMAPDTSARVEGGVRRLEIAKGPGGFVFRVDADRSSGLFHLTPAGGLAPVPGRPRGLPPLVVLTARGTDGPAEQHLAGACPRIVRQSKGEGGVAALTVGLPGRPATRLQSGAGAGLAGLPLP